MDTHKRLHENISALADGELPHTERELAFAALDTAEGKAVWRAYHLIGDVLRDEADGGLGESFSAELAARQSWRASALEFLAQQPLLDGELCMPVAPPLASVEPAQLLT